ncbi:alpha/beta hydrolase [Paracoccus zeaxanthinifaciens]|uniref:alpha/beta hydrolase n=1 Tax=Paracoccus zeaxanthinifaciens TaxID=187400 RepID=UPI0003B35217|nr:alpha/beta hydrolase-fold protein [Paracoccus zeaxanthinifaciens]
MLRFLTLCFGLLLSSAAGAEVRMQNVIGSEVLGRPVGYSLYLPPGYGTDKRDYPVVWLLHGGGTGQPSDWFTLAGIDQMLDALIASGTIRPLIAIAPDGRRDEANEIATYFLDDADGQVRWQTMFLTEMIPVIEARYPAIGTGEARAILGISMGGLAGIVHHLQNPGMFAGVAALSPAFRTDAQLLSLSDDAYRTRYAGVLGADLAADARLTKTWGDLAPGALIATASPSRVPRILIDLGADDPFLEGATEMHLASRNAGLPGIFRVRTGGHDWPFWREALPDALIHLDALLTRGYGE